MKKIILVLLITLTAGALQAQETQTSIQYEWDGNTVHQIETESKVETKKDTTGSLPFAADINKERFNEDDLAALVAGLPVTIDSEIEKIPTRISYVVEILRDTEQTYQRRSGQVELTDKPSTEATVDIPISILMIYLPVICILIVGFVSKSTRKFLNFAGWTTLAIGFGIAVGMLSGDPSAGFIAGLIAGVIAGVFSGGLAGGFAGGLAGGLAGLFASEITANLSAVGMSTSIIWLYLLYYAVFCLVVAAIREIVVRTKAQKETAVSSTPG